MGLRGEEAPPHKEAEGTTREVCRVRPEGS